jgi:hypothetical protein
VLIMLLSLLILQLYMNKTGYQHPFSNGLRFLQESSGTTLAVKAVARMSRLFEVVWCHAARTVTARIIVVIPLLVATSAAAATADQAE